MFVSKTAAGRLTRGLRDGATLMFVVSSARNAVVNLGRDLQFVVLLSVQ
jgi:hypothetical protein